MNRLKKRRKKKRMIQKLIVGTAALFCIGGLIACASVRKDRQEGVPATESELETVIPEDTQEIIETTENKETVPPYAAEFTEDTLTIQDEISSTNAILIDVEEKKVVAQKGALDIINPASMTKVLTILAAAEQLEDLDAPFQMPFEATDYSYVNDCSTAGFIADEQITVRDLFYGTILPSGAEAAMGLAIASSGSQEAFMERMNQKLEELGCGDSAHFTNCVGVYDENHHCSVYDMAMVMKAALENPWCREVMSTHSYRTSVTEQHPEGLVLVNRFFGRTAQSGMPGTLVCAKTGYVELSGSCAVSYGETPEGKGYICVTVGAESAAACATDHVNFYHLAMQ